MNKWIIALWLGIASFTAYSLVQANADINYVKAHPVVVTRIQVRTVVVYRRSDEVNVIDLKAGLYCRDHGGVAWINLYPWVPENWSVVCNNKDAVFSDAGLLLESKSP